MQYRLRTLLIVLAVGPLTFACAWWMAKPHILHGWRQWTRQGPPGWVDDGGEIYYFQAVGQNASPDEH